MRKPNGTCARIECLVLILVALALFHTPALAQPYTVSVLPSGYRPCAITADGVVCTTPVGAWNDPNRSYDTYLWKRGALTLVAPGLYASDGINGRIVGRKYTGDTRPNFPTVFENDAFSMLLCNARYSDGSVSAINSSGTAVGMLYSENPDCPPSYTPTVPYQPVLWNGGWPFYLDTLGGDYGEPIDINSAGDIVGVSRTSNGLDHACRWLKNRDFDYDYCLSDIGYYLPGQCLPSVYSTATRINDKGEILVMIYPTLEDRSRGHCSSFIFSKGQFGNEYREVVAPPDFQYPYASGLNNLGQVVGRMSSDYDSRAFIWNDGVTTDINSLVSPAGWCSVTNAIDIDDAGTIIGYGICDGQGRGVVLSPLSAGIPTIISFSPAVGIAGDTVTITGATLTDAAAVEFNGVPATSFTVNSATSITAVVPKCSTGPITVTTPSGIATSVSSFTFIPAPTVTSFTPTSGGKGCIIAITGTDLTGATAVSIGGIPVKSFSVAGPTSISALVPDNATGSVSVTTPGGLCTSSSSFTFTPGPTITSPTTADACDVYDSVLKLAGVAPAGTTRVAWSNSRGGSGTCSGTTSWSVKNIKLYIGRNIIIVTATNRSGQSTTTTLVVTFTDVTSPTVTVKSPSSRGSYSSTKPFVSLTGASSDNVGVTSVNWSNTAAGASGACSGTTSWKVPSVPLVLGQNSITVAAADSSGNVGTSVIVVSCKDKTKPKVTIAGPAGSSSLSVRTPTITLSGTASDDFGVVSVDWVNNRGGNGTCTGTNAWGTSLIALQAGRNKIIVTARDATGNTATDTLTITYTP